MYIVKEGCPGCGACMNVCPVGAVTVERFAYIAAEKCIECGLCANACPVKLICEKKEKPDIAPEMKKNTKNKGVC